jgi:TolB-like protein
LRSFPAIWAGPRRRSTQQGRVGRRGYRFIGAIAADAGSSAGAASPRGRIRSLAVLPLANLSNDTEQEYFSDGMTDALISQLAGIGSLRIISRQSVMRYKGSVAPMPEIARALGVDALIEGTVLKSSERVRISAQLIHGTTDCHLWSAQYEQPLDDVIAIQAAIARAVATQVRAAITEQETARLARPDSVDPRAYDLYLRGRFFWAQRSEAGLRRRSTTFVVHSTLNRSSRAPTPPSPRRTVRWDLSVTCRPMR